MAYLYNPNNHKIVDNPAPAVQLVVVGPPPVDTRSPFEIALDKMETYYSSRVKKARSKKTIWNKRQCLWALYNKLGYMDYSQEYVDKVMKMLDAEGKKPKVKNNYSYALRWLYNANGYNVRDEDRPGYIVIPIFDYMDEEAKYHSLDEIKRIIAQADNWPWRAVLDFLYYEAVRVSELCAVKMSDLDLDRQTVTIYAQKTSKKRTIWIDDECMPSLRKWLEIRVGMIEAIKANNEPVPEELFLSRLGRKRQNVGIQKIVNVCAASAGLKSHPHKFRHSRANHLLHVYDWNPASVAYFIGDTLDMLYKVYGHTGTEDIMREAERMRKDRIRGRV